MISFWGASPPRPPPFAPPENISGYATDLGSLVTVDSISTTDINARLTIARHATLQLTGFRKQKTSAWTWRNNLYDHWYGALYGSGSWALKKYDEKLVTAFEMWVWHRMLRISWTERKTNTWIREKIGIPEEKGILEQIKHRKLYKYCHWKRRSDSVIPATIIEGEIEGTWFPGRRRTAWIDDVRRWTWTWREQMQWKEYTTAGSRMSTGRSAYGIRTTTI